MIGDTSLAAAILAVTFATIEYWKRSAETKNGRSGMSGSINVNCPMHGQLMSEIHDIRKDVRELIVDVGDVRSAVAVLKQRMDDKV